MYVFTYIETIKMFLCVFLQRHNIIRTNEYMPKRITTIVGAGAVLDFEFSSPGALFPSTQNITKEIIDLKVQGLYNDTSDIINDVFTLACNSLTALYEKRDLHCHYELNFEELYFLIESVMTFCPTGIEHTTPKYYPILSSLIKVSDELTKYPYIEYVRALNIIVAKIVNIIDTYDTHFRDNPNSELWYRNFWHGNTNLKFDIFTFNYDTTIENSMIEYEDGYNPIKDNKLGISYFDPKKLLTNSQKLSTIQHLHGCIYYSEYAPIECIKTHSNRDMFKMRTVQDALKQIGLQSDAQSQARESFLNSPILIGLRKLDKMIYMPNSIYHANLVNKLSSNKGLLIVGYSFGDLYVNQLIQRRLIMKGERHRMVIIDYFPEYINSAVRVRRHILDHRTNLYVFLKPFINFNFDDNFNYCGLKYSSYYNPIYSEDKRIMLFICGFKKAVESHADLIIKHLS